MLGVHAGLRKRRNRAAHARRATVDGPPGARTHSMPRPRGHACVVPQHSSASRKACRCATNDDAWQGYRGHAAPCRNPRHECRR